MDAYLRLSYSLELTDKEMRLVNLGLCGKLFRTEDVKDALDLNLRILKLQQLRIHEQSEKIDGAVQKAEESSPPKETK